MESKKDQQQEEEKLEDQKLEGPKQEEEEKKQEQPLVLKKTDSAQLTDKFEQIKFNEGSGVPIDPDFLKRV